jgi:hypothetical protein
MTDMRTSKCSEKQIIGFQREADAAGQRDVQEPRLQRTELQRLEGQGAVTPVWGMLHGLVIPYRSVVYQLDRAK